MARPKKVKKLLEEENDESVVLENEAEEVEESVEEEATDQSKEQPAPEDGEQGYGEPYIQEIEVVFLPPYEPRFPKTGKFVEKVGIHSVFETEDGKRWAVPYSIQHASLKEGDEFTF